MYVIWWLTYYRPLSILPPPPLSSSWSVCSSFFLLPGSSLFLDLPRSFFFLEDIRGSAEGCDHRGTGRDDYDVGGAGGQRQRTRQGQRQGQRLDPKRRREGETVERQTRTDEGRAVLSLSYHCLITAASSSHSLTCLIPSCLISLPRCSH